MNLTYNLSPMLRAAGMPPWSEFIGMEVEVAWPIWERVVKELRRDRAKYEAMNPPNGWGSYEQAIATLSEFIHECREAHPGSRIGGWL